MVKKGQVETMGLVVIVILVVFIALIFLRYSGESIDSEDKYLSIKINNFLNALRQVDIGDDNFEKIVIDCCDGELISCEVVESYVGYLEVGLDDFYLELTCMNDNPGVVVGTCSGGVASGNIVLITADKISTRICRND